MKKLMFGLCLLIFAVTSCTQYIYVPVDKLPWIDDDKEEQEEFIPNITDNAGFAAAIAIQKYPFRDDKRSKIFRAIAH